MHQVTVRAGTSFVEVGEHMQVEEQSSERKSNEGSKQRAITKRGLGRINMRRRFIQRCAQNFSCYSTQGGSWNPLVSCRYHDDYGVCRPLAVFHCPRTREGICG
jgi:hypothetical protein